MVAFCLVKSDTFPMRNKHFSLIHSLCFENCSILCSERIYLLIYCHSLIPSFHSLQSYSANHSFFYSISIPDVYKLSHAFINCCCLDAFSSVNFSNLKLSAFNNEDCPNPFQFQILSFPQYLQFQWQSCRLRSINLFINVWRIWCIANHVCVCYIVFHSIVHPCHGRLCKANILTILNLLSFTLIFVIGFRTT